MKKYTVKLKPEVRPEKKIDWVNRPPGQPAGRPKAQNIIPQNTIGLHTAAAKAAKTHIKAWELYFDNDMIQLLLTHTNRSISATRDQLPASAFNANSKLKRCVFEDTNELEIRALFGLMYYRGMLNQNLEKVDHLWNDQTGHPVFGATMAKERFKFLKS